MDIARPSPGPSVAEEREKVENGTNGHEQDCRCGQHEIIAEFAEINAKWTGFGDLLRKI
jgi:hypothetical protein